jgi:hypothetical protein
MKKTILTLFIGALFVFGLSSCEECKECKVVTSVDGEVVDQSSPEEYCGDDLEAIDGEESQTGDQVTKWVCE